MPVDVTNEGLGNRIPNQMKFCLPEVSPKQKWNALRLPWRIVTCQYCRIAHVLPYMYTDVYIYKYIYIIMYIYIYIHTPVDMHVYTYIYISNISVYVYIVLIAFKYRSEQAVKNGCLPCWTDWDHPLGFTLQGSFGVSSSLDWCL